jgi:hypothetical protein
VSIRPRAVAATAAALLLALTACSAPTASEQPPSASSCDAALVALPPIEEVDGLFVLVSSELAQTLDSCSTYTEWMLALQRTPSAVGAEEISDELALEYLASACTLRRTVLGEAGPQCEAAAADGVIA